jgi:photosystem II stability/assembly factor-like uncharacterized protein
MNSERLNSLPRKFTGYVQKMGLSILLICATSLLAFSQNKNYVYPQKLYSALKYRNIGPYRGGRSIAVAGQKDEPYTFYFGSTGGGVWKTTDGGITWINVSDKYFKTGAVGALAVAPSDPNVVYAGMGESFIRGNMATGDGVYKSTDGGKTWENVGLKNTHVISNIVIDPKNPDIVYAAALGHVFANNKERGIYRSEDGGITWKKVLYVNDQTGAVDIALDPNNPRVIYAAFWQAYRKPWMMSSGGAGSGLYKSTDGGNTWTNLSKNPGMPKGVMGKIGVSVSGANSDRVYAIIEAKHGGVFRSDDAGKTWHRLYHKSELTQRAWYYSRIYADPQNENVVYAPQVSGLFKSVDGGKTFHPLRTQHGDNHVLWINPKNPQIMIESNDGGANVTYNGGKSWSEEDQATAQFYHVSVDNRFPYHVYGAQQDNSTVNIVSRTNGYGITNKDWFQAAGGESGYVVPDPTNPHITYGGGYDGALTIYNHETGQRQMIDVWPDNPMGHGAAKLKERFQWTYPIVISPHNPSEMYVTSQYVYKSTDHGMSWKRISPDLTKNDKSKQQSSGGPITQDNTAVEYYDTIFAFDESPVKAGILWAGSDDGLVHVSKDGGKTWENVTPKELPDWATISIIEPSHFDAGTAYIAARKFRQDDFHPYLYKTTDYGKHWKKITKGIPENEYTFVIRQDTKKKNLLFAGTQRGVYVSFNDGNDWQPLQLNLPHVPVRDMAIQNRENDLVLATHGRSFWIMDNLEVLRQISDQVEKSDMYLYKPEHAYLTGGRSFHRPGVTIGENPPNGAVIFYYLKNQPSEKETVSLEFMTASGDSIISFSNKTTPQGKSVRRSNTFYKKKGQTPPGVISDTTGMNRFVWNLRYPDATHVPGAVLWYGNMRGPKIVPGAYKVKLTVNGHSTEKEFEVKKDPRIKASQQDLEAQLALLKKVHEKLDKTDKAINHIRSVRDQINSYLKQLKKYPKVGELKKTAQPILDSLKTIEDNLIQVKAHASEDPLNYPIKLNNKLAALASAISSSYNRPTKQEYDVFNMLSAKVDHQLDQLKPIMDNEVPKFNQKVQSMNIPAVYLSNSDN